MVEYLSPHQWPWPTWWTTCPRGRGWTRTGRCTPGLQFNRRLKDCLNIALSGAFLNVSLTPALTCALTQALNSICLLNFTPVPQPPQQVPRASDHVRGHDRDVQGGLHDRRTVEAGVQQGESPGLSALYRPQPHLCSAGWQFNIMNAT